MEEKKIIRVDLQTLAGIHNTLINTRPTGEDIIKIAAACMDIRRLIDEGTKEADQGKEEETCQTK